MVQNFVTSSESKTYSVTTKTKREYLTYHLSTIDEATRKSYLEDMLIRGNHNSERSVFNTATPKKQLKKT